MKHLFILGCSVFSCLCCSAPKSEPEKTTDSTQVVKNDSAELVIPVSAEPENITSLEQDEVVADGEVKEVKGELVYEITNWAGFISDPFEFQLDTEALTAILGPEATVKVDDFEAGEDFSAYSVSTVKWKDSEVKFYSFSGKHFADIYTPLLPLKYDIKIGMTKTSFLETMNQPGPNAQKATVYEIHDDYGMMSFHFRADTLYYIDVYYEEGT